MWACLTLNDTVVVDPTDIRAVDASNQAYGPSINLRGKAGFVVVTCALVVEFKYEPPFWVHAALWGPLILITTLLPLRPLPPLRLLLLELLPPLPLL